MQRTCTGITGNDEPFTLPAGGRWSTDSALSRVEGDVACFTCSGELSSSATADGTVIGLTTWVGFPGSWAGFLATGACVRGSF